MIWFKKEKIDQLKQFCLGDENVRATVITGVAAQDNGSDTVQVFARKEFRDWRYKMDIYVGGIQIFFDTAWQKTLHFQGKNILRIADEFDSG